MSNNPTARIKRALLSVSDKNGLEDFARELKRHGISLLSTGGTARTLQNAGIDVQDISGFTGFPEIMDGRVKTLHPKVHGGILARRDDDDHRKAMTDNAIEPIDMVVVNLYPFAATVAAGKDFDECIENIDIGGPALIRAAAKNHEFVTIVTDPQDYEIVLEDLAANKGATSLPLRRNLAAAAYAHTAAYDSHVSGWFARQAGKAFPRQVSFSGTLRQELRYGENPHQKAALYNDGTNTPGVATATQIQGKELSYNNINDTDAAFELVAEFGQPAVAIIKHANPCGVALADSPLAAYKAALACDPVSAFGGIIALNRPLDAATCEEIIKVFSEVIIAPGADEGALEILRKKDKVRLLLTDSMPDPRQTRPLVKSMAGGFLLQDSDSGHVEKSDLKVVTKRYPEPDEMRDMLFAFRVAKHVKSNAIVFAKNNATIGIGAGQMSRIDSAKIAAAKGGQKVRGSAAASDAFFPFADGLIAVAAAGATAIIQPGGSIRDSEVIAAADERGVTMVFTGIRHFRH